MDKMRLGVASPSIVDVERLEECAASLDGPTTVLEACEQERQLITLVRQYPALYDGRHPRFHDDTYKEQLWKRITGRLNIELTQCLVTWSELRYRYQRHVRRLRAFHRSAVHRKLPTRRRRPCLRHEEELQFLYPHVARFPLVTLEESDSDGDGNGNGEGEGEGEDEEVPEVEIVEPPPVVIIDVDLVEDASGGFRCTRDERRLIEAVSAYPQLYNSHHPQYSNLRHRGLIWGSISNELRDKATKLIKNWLKLRTRFEWEVTHSAGPGRESELCQLMAFMRPHLLRLRGTVCQNSKYLQTSWHEPIENFRSVLALINAMRTMPELVQLVDSHRLKAKPPIYDELWLKVGKAVAVSHERCEVTWLVLRTFHAELTAMRQAGYQLQDKWYFENVLNGIVRLAAARAAKRVNNKRPHNGDASTGEMGPPPAKITPPPAKITPPKITSPKITSPKITSPEPPPPLPIAIVYPPSMKNCSIVSNSSSSTATTTTTTSSSGGGSGQTLANATSSSSNTVLDFVIPTLQGNVRVSTVPRAQVKSMKSGPLRPPSQAPSSQAPNPLRPGPQLAVRHKMSTPLASSAAPVPLTLPSGIIRAMPPPPPAPLPVIPTVTLHSGPSSSLVEKPQVSAIRMQVVSRPKLAKLLPKSSEMMTAPMVRIHQPSALQGGELDHETGKFLPVLTAAAIAAHQAATSRRIGTVGGEVGVGVAAVVETGAVAAYSEVATTSSASSRPPPKAPAPIILKATGTSLPPVVLPVSITNRMEKIMHPEATSVTPAALAAPKVTPAAPPVTTAAPTVTPAAPKVTQAAPKVTPAALAAPKVTPAAPKVTPAAQAAPKVTPAAPKVTPAAPPVAIAAPAPPPVTIAAPDSPPETTASPPIDPDEAPSTSRSIPTDFGQSPHGICMNAINVNLVHSASGGNSLRIWGGGLNCNYHLNMVRAATLIREVMAVPQLHSEDPRLKGQINGFWQLISQKFHLPEVALRACWNFLANNMSLFPAIAPMSELMRPLKGNLEVWQKSNRLFGKFDEIARKYDWMKHKEVIPDLIRHFRQHEHLYWEMRKPRPGEPKISVTKYTDRERQEVWREAKIKFPDLNHHDIWSMFKFAFRKYMEDLESGIENPWPQNWWQALEQLKFLASVRYHPLEPYYYIVHNKILEEVKRCSMHEALTSSDSTDKSKTSAMLARVCKEPLPWCSEEAKRLLTGKLSRLGKAPETVPLPVREAELVENDTTEETEPEPEPQLEPEPQPPPPQPAPSRSLVKRVPVGSGSRPAFTLPTIEVFELSRMLRRYPHTFQRVHTINKRTAWVRVSKELKVTVTECRLGLQYALREMRLLKILDPRNLCSMNHKYYQHMDEIYKQVKTKSKLTVRTPEQMNELVAAEVISDEVLPQQFMPGINMSNCKPSLVLRNWSYAIGSLPSESQDILAIKLKYLFAKYEKKSSREIS